jgi:hypothetical protein
MFFLSYAERKRRHLGAPSPNSPASPNDMANDITMPARTPWTQTNKEILMVVPLTAPVKAREILWRLTTKDVELRIKGAAEPLLTGVFFHPVRPDDSTWELEDAPGGGKEIRIGLAKARPNMAWDCCFLDEVDETITHHCFMDVSIGGRPMGRVVYGLYGNAYPKTVENFRCLCTGERGSVRVRKKAPLIRLHYKGTSFFRRASRCSSSCRTRARACRRQVGGGRGWGGDP